MLPRDDYKTGERLSAADWNRLVDAVQGLIDKRLAALVGRPGGLYAAPGVQVDVRNITGETLYPSYIVGLGDSVFQDDDAKDFLKEPVIIEAKLPDLDRPGSGSTGAYVSHRGKWAVVADEIPEDGVGKAWLSGVCWVKVEYEYGTEEYCDIADQELEHLAAKPIGTGRILYKSSEAAGPVWCLVMFPAFWFPPVFEATSVGGTILAKPIAADGTLIDQTCKFDVLAD
jgi:hypothetical protein